jgi:hypothetical protein
MPPEPNGIFNIVVKELEAHVGDILAKGITKKALEKVGSSADAVGVPEMGMALDGHVFASLTSFMTKDRARECVRSIRRKLEADGNAN